MISLHITFDSAAKDHRLASYILLDNFPINDLIIVVEDEKSDRTADAILEAHDAGLLASEHDAALLSAWRLL